MICIAIDAMGGDQGSQVTVPAALYALDEYPYLSLILVGDQKEIHRTLTTHSKHWDKSRLIVKHTTQVVQMDELPAQALRRKKNSSMRIAINLVQEGEAQACISAGNTGALMATAKFVLKMLPGIDRPAILFSIPSESGEVNMLDLGANVECTADHLVQFAVMGSVLITLTSTKKNPRVGLLNVGSEAIKGTDAVKHAAQILQHANNINYIGFIEGNDIYKGCTDVVVCDGFVGNVALKSSEGIAKMILKYAQEEFENNWITRLCALICKPVLKKIYSRLNPNNYNGGSLLGLQGIVLKSHGNANVDAFVTAIRKAIQEIQMNIPEQIHESVSSILGELEIE